MIFGVNVEWLGLGFLFGSGVWVSCWALTALRRTLSISMDLSE